MDDSCSIFVCDNFNDGFNVYGLESGVFVKELCRKARGQIRRRVMQLAFVEGNTAIVGGGAHGHATVWDVDSGKVIASLKHANRGFVQTIAVSVLVIHDNMC
jgi:WD40 repeat protein